MTSRPSRPPFREQYALDQRAGAVRPLAAYLQIYPESEEAVLDAYLELEHTRLAEGSLGTVTHEPAGTKEMLGPYRILRELGRGGQGCVYLAEDTRLGRKVALKVLTVAGRIEDELIERFRREAEMASRLDHPGICPIYEAGAHDGMPFIAMRFIEGRTLRERILTEREPSSGPSDSHSVFDSHISTTEDEEDTEADTRERPSSRQSVHNVIEIVEKVARALHYAHECGILHRDIKPANIVMTPSGQPVVLDFGLARELETQVSELTHSGELFGTPVYMSPEQLVAHRIVLDRRTDIWSLGVTCYECLTLTRPFDAPSRQGLYAAILAKSPPDPRARNPSIPRDLKVVLETALEKDRDRRYSTALDFAEDLRRVREREPIQARPLPWHLKVARWTQRHPAATLGIGISVLFVAVSLLTLAHHAATLARERDTIRALLSQIESLSESKLLHQDLKIEAARGWSPYEAGAGERIQGFLTRLDRLSSRAPNWGDELEELLRRGGIAAADLPERTRDAASDPETLLAAWSLLIERTRGLSASDLERAGELRDLLHDTEILVRHRKGLAERTLEFANNVRHETLENHHAAWEQVAREVAREHPALRVTPQVGLVPLGRDPKSGLFEFAHLQTGEPPTRNASGQLEISERTSLVLILVPPGRLTMGSKPGLAHEPNHAPGALPQEGPPHDVPLAPYFLSKFEMTRGQWFRADATRPSQARPDNSLNAPVDGVSWHECERVLGNLGLSLPTEAQWEYAARATTTTPWHTGSDPSDLEGSGNLADRARKSRGGLAKVDWDDGYALESPVGTFAPNRWGFHDTVGNVREWCRDFLIGYDISPRFEDGLREFPPGSPGTEIRRVLRGSDWDTGIPTSRTSYRDGYAPDFSGLVTGVRPSRALNR